MLCYVLLCYVMLCYVMLCYALCYVMFPRDLMTWRLPGKPGELAAGMAGIPDSGIPGTIDLSLSLPTGVLLLPLATDVCMTGESYKRL